MNSPILRGPGRNFTPNAATVAEFIARKERINYSFAASHPFNCPVIEQTGDVKECGTCWFYMKDGKTCSRHGRVKR